MTSTKPKALEVWPRHVPDGLKAVRGWVLWRFELRGDRWTKPPVNEAGLSIDAHNPDNWMDFSTAYQAYQRGGFDGIGFSLTAMEDLAGVDLDHCVKGGVIEPWALEIVSELKGYSEISPSGEGVRILGYGKLKRDGRKKGDIEMYDGGRYLTVTGHKLDNSASGLVDFDEALNHVHDQIWHDKPEPEVPHEREGGKSSVPDEKLLEKIRSSKQADYFDRLNAGGACGYTSDSEADLAFCNLLAFWTGRDSSQMDRIFRASGRMRPKWDEKHGSETYGAGTITKAINGCGEVYRLSKKVRANDLDLGLKDFCVVKTVRKEEVFVFSPDKAAATVLKIFEIISTPDKRIWIYEDGIFEPTGDYAIEAIIDDAVGDLADTRARNETLARVRLRTRQEYDVFDADPCLFCVANGVLDMRTGEFLDHSPEYRRTWKAPVVYGPGAKMVELQKFLDTALDEDGRETFLDILAAKTTGLTFEYFSPWIGRGQNGKTKAEDMIRAFWGDDQVTEVEVSTLSQNRFDMVELRGKSFVINTEVAGGKSEIRWIKAISGGGRFTADQKGRDHIKFRPHCFIIFDCNNPPRFDDNTHGFGRRIAPIYWRYSFVDNPKEDFERLRDPDILEKIAAPGELSGLLNVLIERAPGVIKSKTIYRSGTGDEIASKYDIQSSHRELFWDWFVEADPDENVSSAWLYKTYVEFCELEGVTPVRDRAFGDRGRYLKFKKGRDFAEDGARIKVWANCSFNTDEWNDYLLRSQRSGGTRNGPASDPQEPLSRPSGPSRPSISPIVGSKENSGKDVSIGGGVEHFDGPAGPAGPDSDLAGHSDRQQAGPAGPGHIPDELRAEALSIVAGLNGKSVTFGNVEAYLEARTGEFAPPKAVNRVLKVLTALGWSTSKDGILSPPVVAVV